MNPEQDNRSISELRKENKELKDKVYDEYERGYENGYNAGARTLFW